jgi:hypothetical protein
MNWGYKILVGYGIFVAGMMFLVFKSANQTTDLVTSDYYAKELKYQDRIEQSKRTGNLSASVVCKMVNNELEITFPNDFLGKVIGGDVLLYCPSDSKKDIAQPFNLKDSNVYKMTIPAIYKGLHEIQINWVVDGKSYYYEEKIFI